MNSTLVQQKVTLATGDRIQVRFAYSPDWNQELDVYPDGSASFLGIDKLPVAGLLPEQLDEQLTELYAEYLDNPDLTIIILQQSARSVTVMGEVEVPGPVEIPRNGRLTLVEAIGRAGGHIKSSAYLGSTILVRWDAAAQERKAWTIDARPEHWIAGEPVYLQQYDIVYVPNTPVDDVNRWVDQYVRQMIPIPFTIFID